MTQPPAVQVPPAPQALPLGRWARGAQTPPWQAERSQALPSKQSANCGAVAQETQAPLKQASPAAQVAVSVQAIGPFWADAVQAPAWQVPEPGPLPALQALPSALAGFEQAPVEGLQLPAAWHWSWAAQVTPAQRSTATAQVVPVKPVWQAQAKPVPAAVQLPPLTQGLGWQGSGAAAQEKLPGGEVVPAAQEVQELLPADAEKVLAAQGVQLPLLTEAEKVPTGQAAQLPLLMKVPGAQVGAAATQVPAEQVPGPLPLLQAVPSGALALGGQATSEPSQDAAIMQGPVAARHTIVEGATASAGQAGLVPVQVSARSQAPADARHTVLEGAKASAGQAGLVPVQVSARSQAPADARQTVLEGA